MPEYHLGIYTGHDTGVAVVDDGLNIVWVFEEERFNGEKMTYFNPYFSLREMLRVGPDHFRTITFGFDPDEGRADFLKKFVRFQKVRTNEILSYLWRKVSWDEVRFVGHHDCHAAGAFFPSGYREAAVLVADGTGESESTSLYRGGGNSVTRISTELTNDFSLGILYQYFTEWLGYRSHNTSQHCGKIMGLASYGDPVYRERIYSLLERDGDRYRWAGGSLINMRSKMVEALGLPQPRPVEGFNRVQADVAASIQAVLEEIVLEKLTKVKEILPFEDLCFAGGVAMNSQLNYRMLKSGICRNLFVQPLASDRGIALGAALASAALMERPARVSPARHRQGIYLGYGEDSQRGELDRILDEYDLPVHVERDGISPGEIARLLDANQILALFQGRQEIGPRALGNRSILAAPTVQARDRTNRLIKYREPWRPFAPTILEEEVARFFDIDRPEPFMTVIYGVLPGMKKGVEGITHVDGTARLQTVSHAENPFFHAIIKEYGKITGTPVLLNTSFNINGQPIVRSVYDAILTFLCSGIDGLLIGNTMVRKTADLPRDHLNRLDRVLAQATRHAKTITIQLLDFSDHTADIILEFLASPCIRFRRIYGQRPISKCYMSGHTKTAWNIMSKIGSSVGEFVFGHPKRPPLRQEGICIVVTGKYLIEASSRPTRTYVKFDREIFREIVESYAEPPCGDRYFLLDREFHLFDMVYLKARFRPFFHWTENGDRLPALGHTGDREGSARTPPFSESPDETVSPDTEYEDMYDTLADA